MRDGDAWEVLRLAMTDFSALCNPDLDARDALVEYKLALVGTNYRNFWHRFLYWCREPEATRAELALRAAEEHVRVVAQRSEAHRLAMCAIAARQPLAVREQDGFLALLSD